MTNLEKAQEYLNNLEAEMRLAQDSVKSLSDADFRPSHHSYIAASTAAIKYNTAYYMMKLMTDAMLEQHVNDKQKDEKKYRYRVCQSAEGCTTGTVLLTKAQAEAVRVATDIIYWDDLEEESYSGSFCIDIDNPEEV